MSLFSSTCHEIKNGLNAQIDERVGNIALLRTLAAKREISFVIRSGTRFMPSFKSLLVESKRQHRNWHKLSSQLRTYVLAKYLQFPHWRGDCQCFDAGHRIEAAISRIEEGRVECDDRE